MLIGVDNFGVEIESPGLFLRCLRGITGLSRRELAEKCEISHETVKKIEEGESQGGATTWARIARVMGTDSLSLAANLVGAATDILGELDESIAEGSEDIRLYYLISPSGKLVVYDSDYFDEDADGESHIIVSLEKAKTLLEWQKKELGS